MSYKNYVCSRHFRPEDIERKYGKVKWKNFLKPDALPIANESIFENIEIKDETEEEQEYNSETTDQLMDSEIVKEDYAINGNSVAVERTSEDQRLREERQITIRDVMDILETVANNSTSTNTPAVSVEEGLANAYGEYVKTKFKNWNVPQQIQGFKMVNEAIEKFEKMNKN